MRMLHALTIAAATFFVSAAALASTSSNRYLKVEKDGSWDQVTSFTSDSTLCNGISNCSGYKTTQLWLDDVDGVQVGIKNNDGVAYNYIWFWYYMGCTADESSVDVQQNPTDGYAWGREQAQINNRALRRNRGRVISDS